MNIDYIIVQAGGNGSRLEHLTKNKPKAIVSFENRPLIFHLFKLFKNKKFIIIADYKADVFEKYLETFAEVDFLMIKPIEKGTCSGINDALKFIPENKGFMLAWSDVLLSEGFSLDSLPSANYVGISKDFQCRYTYISNEFLEAPSAAQGVAGIFAFQNKNEIADTPQNGEFVDYLASKQLIFKELPLTGSREIGELKALSVDSALKPYNCRPFNKIIENDKYIVKVPQDKTGYILAGKEQQWYKTIVKCGYPHIPKIAGFDPLTMEKCEMKSITLCNYSPGEKQLLLDNIMNSLFELHSIKVTHSDSFSLWDNYYLKTVARLEKVRCLLPFSNSKYITINNKKCRNIFFFYEEFKQTIRDKLVASCNSFSYIHGDCTLSNILAGKNLNIKLIDPRGYFGGSQIYGDVYYDYAKLYYSISGNYDMFNRKMFSLDISEPIVNFIIESNGWEILEDHFLSLIPNIDIPKLKLIHAIIWLSLTTYAWDDYDSVCVAFYNGIYLLEDLL